MSGDERAVVDAAVARRLAEVKRERALEACRRGELGAVASHDRLFGAECDAVARENEAVDAYMGRRFPKQMDPEQMAAVMGRARNREIQS